MVGGATTFKDLTKLKALRYKKKSTIEFHENPSV
jgi:hypothetical protein